VRLGLATGSLRNAAWLQLQAFDLDRYFEDGGFGDDAADRHGLLAVDLSEPAPYSRSSRRSAPDSIRCGCGRPRARGASLPMLSGVGGAVPARRRPFRSSHASRNSSTSGAPEVAGACMLD